MTSPAVNERPARTSIERSRLQRTRAALLIAEGLFQGLALIAVVRARPPLYGVLLALLVWVTLLGEPSRALLAGLRGIRTSRERAA